MVAYFQFLNSNPGIVDVFEQDLRAAVEFLDANPSHKPSGAAAARYG